MSEELKKQAETPGMQKNLSALANDQIDQAMLPRDLLDSKH